MLTTVFVAGYGNSTEGHWQNSWSKLVKNSHWVEQGDWGNPNCVDWVDALNAVIESIDGPILLVSHSLGGSTIVEWSKKFSANSEKIVGAFMVAVPDVQSADLPKAIIGYQAPPLDKLPFPSILLASTNDPYSTLEQTKYFANLWGSSITVVGDLKHINAGSGLGEWSDGLNMLNTFLNSIDSTLSLNKNNI